MVISVSRASAGNAVLALLMFMAATGSLPICGQMICNPITTKQKTELESFVSLWYKLPKGETMTLVDTSEPASDCYRKLAFRPSIRASLLTLYLTPDGKHLVSGLMDLTADPAIAQRKMRQEFTDKLSSGATLIKGPESTPLKMVVFSDFQCPYCKQFADIMQQLTPDDRAK